MKKNNQEILTVSHFDFNLKELKSYYNNHLETLRLKYTYINWLFHFFKNKNEDIPDLYIIDREKVKMAMKRGYSGDRCNNCGSYTIYKAGSKLKCTTCKDSYPGKYLLSDLLSVWDWVNKELIILKRKIKNNDQDFLKEIKHFKIIEGKTFQKYLIKPNIRLVDNFNKLKQIKRIKCLVKRELFIEAFLKLEKDWDIKLAKFQSRYELEELIDIHFDFVKSNYENEFKNQLVSEKINYRKIKWIGKRGNVRLLAYFIDALVSNNILSIELHNILDAVRFHFCKNTGDDFNYHRLGEAFNRYNGNKVRGREYVKSFINYIKPDTYP